MPAKFKYAIDEKTIAKRIAEGRGSGTGRSYIPWIYVHEVPSKGKSSIRGGWKTGREHHFLSFLEASYFYILEWGDSIIDIREQFPLLPREETQAIATDLGVEHPKDTRTGVDIVITTDVVPTFETTHGSKIKARSVKYEDDLKDQRTKEKQLIEKIYWSRRNVDWNVVTEKSILVPMVQNIQWLHKSRDLFGLFSNIEMNTLQDIKEKILKHLPVTRQKLADFTDALDEYFQVPPSTCLTMVKHLIANKKLVTNMEQVIHPCNVIKITLPR
ncbi:TnsA endonuclease N-terminal domain-containing protein [Paenibacillus allorhizosphaerae]|uniref:Heteromeric transposase endonuclease subunit TnsA n=1 Tax=Paenibacillus allorhizosphaerae TaxID=2849866 RepID=A0ABN7TN42_9BACL|nr:TnsA endonuclease N-terminal domain-containing protein [Paenibacillus allorhizosphaerae]CAG7648094.1 hypothetical protein PAECIP111802_04121 [Paenibacillus allorhizosphaerae]